MSKHTPGPWQHQPNGELTFIPIKAIYCERIGFQLGFINTDSKTLEEQAKANSRLIAAAPDLLTALRDLLSRADKLIWRPAVDDSRQIDQDTRNLREGLEPARAAIAKAEAQ